MREGDVVLAALPQVDGTLKNRPAIFLREMPSHRDLLVCGVSTRLERRAPGFDEIIAPADSDFASSGLVATSLIRLGFLGLVPRMDVLGSIGSISPARHERLLKTLSGYLVRDLPR